MTRPDPHQHPPFDVMTHDHRLTVAATPINASDAFAQRAGYLPPAHAAEVKALLDGAVKQLRSILQDETLMPETPLEVQSAIESATEAVGVALRRLKSTRSEEEAPAASPTGGPTRQQGQFLAFIREYILRNESGVAPRHADFQRFFNLTPPSVNSMLIRLDQRGFIRRIPGQARAIEITCPPEWIPPLDRPFKF